MVGTAHPRLYMQNIKKQRTTLSTDYADFHRLSHFSFLICGNLRNPRIKKEVGAPLKLVYEGS